MLFSFDFLVEKRDTFVKCMSSSISVSVKLLSSPFSKYVCCFYDLGVYV
jgi:hypothetical protein